LERESKIGLHGSGRNSGVLYSGIYYEENSLKANVCGEATRITYQLMLQYTRNNQGFRKYANEEAGRFLKRRFAKAAQLLIPRLKVEQLLNKERHELVMDFVVEQQGNTFHILNAVSPAFTSSFAFARYVVQKLT